MTHIGSHAERIFLSSAARTSTTTSAIVSNLDGFTGLYLFLNVTAASGTGGLQATVEAFDQASSNWVQLSTTPTAVTAVSSKVYALLPLSSVTNSLITTFSSGVLPTTFRVKVTHGDASSYTYSVGGVTVS